ncbi:MAG: trehalase family glycosidase [Armatimonadota bacterium]|nr:trehalase family glycosidase [Armatimonadota bacterium]
MRAALLISLTLIILTALPAAAQNPAPSPKDICEFLKDNNRYTTNVSSYSDLGSVFGVMAGKSTGVGPIVMDWNGGARIFSNSIAELDISETIDGEKQELIGRKVNITCYPHGFRSETRVRDIEIPSFTTFVDTDLLAYVVEITNGTKREVTLTPRIWGIIPEMEGATRDGEFNAQSNMIVLKTTEPRMDMNDPNETYTAYTLIAPSFLAEDFGLGDDPRSLQSAANISGRKSASYSLTGSSFTLFPNQTRRLWILVAVSVKDRAHLNEIAEKASGAVKPIADLDKSGRDRWNKAFRKLPSPPKDPALQRLYYGSALTLLQNAGASDGKFGKNRPCYAIKKNCKILASESPMIAVALAEFDSKLAQEQILILTQNARENGAIPEFITRDWVSESVSRDKPMAAWAAWEVYRRSGDRKFLNEVYSPLSKWVEWWLATCDSDPNGLCEAPPNPDTNLLFDSVETNALLAAQMRSLAKIAKAIGRPEDSYSWDRRAGDLDRRIVEILYSVDDNVFYDVLTGDHSFRMGLSPANFMPLWADVPLPEGRAKAMIEKSLVNRRNFLGVIPVLGNASAVEQEEITRAQPQTAYFIIDILRRYGFHADAFKARERLLNILANTGGNYEFYDSATGKGIGEKSHGVTAAVSIETILNKFGRH